jgi:hypothetical protein
LNNSSNSNNHLQYLGYIVRDNEINTLPPGNLKLARNRVIIVRDNPWFDERDNEGNIIPPRIELRRDNNQRNINLSRQPTIVDETRGEESNSDSNYRIEYEDIPRVVRPVNQNERRERVDDPARGQRRAARWRLNNASAQVMENKRKFKAGADQLWAELRYSHKQIVEGMKRNQFNRDELAAEVNSYKLDAQEIHSAQTNEDNTINELLEQWVGGAHGYVPEKKDDNIIRSN